MEAIDGYHLHRHGISPRCPHSKSILPAPHDHSLEDTRRIYDTRAVPLGMRAGELGLIYTAPLENTLTIPPYIGDNQDALRVHSWELSFQ